MIFKGLLRALKLNLQRHARAIFNKRNNCHVSLLSYMHDKTSIFNRKKRGVVGGGGGKEDRTRVTSNEFNMTLQILHKPMYRCFGTIRYILRRKRHCALARHENGFLRRV